MIDTDSVNLVVDESTVIKPFTLRNLWEARFCKRAWSQINGEMQIRTGEITSSKRLIDLAKRLPLWRLIMYVYLGF
jgi:hypothetical protein